MTKRNCGSTGALVVLLWLSIANGVLAQNTADPIVIELGGQTTVTRSELDSLFNVAIRMLAAQQGLAFAEQKPEQLLVLRGQYLGQRANEMALLQEANRRKISASDADVQQLFDDYLAKIRADVSTDAPVDETILRRLLRDKQQVTLLSEQLLKAIEVRPGDVVVMHHDLEDKLTTPEQSCLRHIVVADPETAKQLMAELKNGADFAEVANKNSTDTSSAKNGGDLGCIARENIVPTSDFERAVFNTGVGELAGPVSSDHGYHLLIVYERKNASTPGLNEVYKDLEKEIRHERLPNKLIEIRDASGVVTYPDRLGD